MSRNEQTSLEKTAALASSILERRKSGAEPYVLFLGAGASVSSGCSGMTKIVDDFLADRDKAEFEQWEQKIKAASAANAEYGQLLKEKIFVIPITFNVIEITAPSGIAVGHHNNHRGRCPIKKRFIGNA